jgi:hypothetical protein
MTVVCSLMPVYTPTRAAAGGAVALSEEEVKAFKRVEP